MKKENEKVPGSYIPSPSPGTDGGGEGGTSGNWGGGATSGKAEEGKKTPKAEDRGRPMIDPRDQSKPSPVAGPTLKIGLG